MTEAGEVVSVVDEKELMTITEEMKGIVASHPKHKDMLVMIQKNLPQVKKDSSMFGKSQSQAMDMMLTVNHHTPVRNIRQMLAEIERSYGALREAHYNRKKAALEIARLEKDLQDGVYRFGESKEFTRDADAIDLQMMEVEIEDKKTAMVHGEKYVAGAIRKVANYTEQINYLKKKHGIGELTEEIFEKEEEEYHIKKVFSQALCAARSRQGWIDEGNQIYLENLGINGAQAQNDILLYIGWEQERMKENVPPTHKDYLEWLQAMYDKYKGNMERYAEIKGVLPMNEDCVLD